MSLFLMEIVLNSLQSPLLVQKHPMLLIRVDTEYERLYKTVRTYNSKWLV